MPIDNGAAWPSFRSQVECRLDLIFESYNLPLNLNAERGLIFRITHISNVEWALENGIQCANSTFSDPHFRQIGNRSLIGKRLSQQIGDGSYGFLSEYVPFYFTPHSMMMYNIKTGYGGVEKIPNKDIVIFVSSLARLDKVGKPWIFSDRHASLRTAQFFDCREALVRLPWEGWRRRDFARDPDDPEKCERYQAEALVRGSLSTDGLLGIACYSENEKRTLDRLCRDASVDLKVVAMPAHYF